MNKRLLMLNGLAIIAVVANHASHSGFVAMFWWTDRYMPVAVPNYDQMGSLAYFLLVAAQKLAVFAVPAFLFTTGIFLAYAARGAQSRLTWAVVSKRILNLLPPFFIWTTVYYILLYLVEIFYTPFEYLAGYFWVETAPYFFVPLIVVYYLLSIYLAPLAKTHPKLILGVGLVVLAGGIMRSYIALIGNQMGPTGESLLTVMPLLPNSVYFEYFFYFIFGLVAGFYQAQIKAFIAPIKWVLLASVILMGLLAVVEAEWVFRIAGFDWRSRTLTLPAALYAISLILTFWAFDNVEIPFSGVLYQLGVDTLGIYLLHKTILIIMPKIVYHAAPFLLGWQFLYQPLLVAAAIGIPVLIMQITRRWMPLKRYYRISFG